MVDTTDVTEARLRLDRLAHDLNNAFTSILNYGTLVSRALQGTPTEDELRLAAQDVEQILQLTRGAAAAVREARSTQ